MPAAARPDARDAARAAPAGALGRPGAAEPADASVPPPSPRADLVGGVAWMAFGAAVLAGSLAMDRLEAQNINPVTIPGLLPALLGAAIVLLGAVLALRAHARRRAVAPAPPAAPADALQRHARRRVVAAIALCLLYSALLVGRGLPFWLASAIFVTATILVMQALSLVADERRVTPGRLARAATIGLVTGGVVHVVFQEIFLVRLP